MIQRKEYLDLLKKWKDDQVIKVITGIRRCGKSTLLGSDAVYQDRLNAVCKAMAAENLDAMLIYADREHGSNFGYFTGFEPRFEEACLVIHRDGTAWIMLGNESLKMHQYSRIPV